jgi:hypothetical protein
MPGRRVIAQRWEGVAEGIRFIPESLQDFRNANVPGPAFRGTSILSTNGSTNAGQPLAAGPISSNIF